MLKEIIENIEKLSQHRYQHPMKAIVIPHHGDLDVIQEIELPTPVPAPNELLIKVEFGGVNMRDTYVRKGLYPEKKFPHILGQEAAGRVEQLPTSKAILEDPAYQRLGLKLGSRVVTVQPPC
jgi:NADPH2:quinone reductase